MQSSHSNSFEKFNRNGRKGSQRHSQGNPHRQNRRLKRQQRYGEDA